MGIKNIKEPDMAVGHVQEPSMDIPHQQPQAVATPEITAEQIEDWRQKKIIEHEGFRLNPYKDTQGYVTGGIGHKFTKEDFQSWDPSWSEEEKREYWLKKFKEDYARASRIAIAMSTKYDIDPREDYMYVLTDMAFNLGPTGLSKFKNFLTDLSNDNVEGAIAEMKRTSKFKAEPSKWYKQVPKRVDALVDILRGRDEPTG